jgi:hypothetical protein
MKEEENRKTEGANQLPRCHSRSSTQWKHTPGSELWIATICNGVFNLYQHFEISYSRYDNKHFITG